MKPETPLPRLSSAASSRSNSHPPCPPNTRPVPPTPHRMRMANMNPNGTEANRHRKRYSVSAIPRPSSGTSRRATPLGLPLLIIPDNEPVQSVQAHRKSFHSTDGKPSSAWFSSKPGTRLPRSDSLLPYRQRSAQDLSGVMQQLHVRHYSTQSLSSPSKIGLTRDTSLTTGGLPKSQSSTSLLSPSRGITPGRRLMKPISPQLPKSQTFSSLSCMSPPSTTPSPQKPVPYRLPRLDELQYRQVDVIDALRESRMTEQEITYLRQVQKEVSTNKDRMKESFDIRQHKQTVLSDYVSPASGSFLRNNGEASINLSANDVANTRRLEDQRRKSASGRPLFINSVPANAMAVESSLSTLTTGASANSSGPEEEWETNNRQVRHCN